MHLRDLVQKLNLIPSEQDIEVSLRIGDVVSNVNHVWVRQRDGKISVEMEAHKPVKEVNRFTGRHQIGLALHATPALL